MSNSTGRPFRVTTFGESHGPALGCVIDGCPAGLALDLEAVQADLDRRRPGQSALTTPRKEADRVEVLSGGGEMSPAQPMELLVLGGDAAARGDRLACQAEVRGDVRVRIPDWF